MQILWYIQSLRFLTFFTSLGTFICHLTQCILLNVYQEKTDIPDWLKAGHWQYLLWFISLGLSLVGSFILCLSACYYNKPRKYSLDKFIGSLSMLPVLVSIVTAMLSYSLEPWTNGFVTLERSASNILSNCKLFDESRDKFYPLLYQRCLLSDFTWILSIALCILWALLVRLVMYALVQKKKEAPQDRIRPAGEPTWGRYIPDRPASIYSATTLGNRSGLLTPSPTKQLDYYYSSAPSLPSLLDYYPLKESYINEKSNDEDDYYYGYSNSRNNESVSSSSYYNNTRPHLTIDCDYQAQTSWSSSSPSLVEPVSAVSGTPLYNSFARKSKNNNLSFRD
ncbi:hypothetical protein BDF21DRAFT_403868 [Thamnidium elegans]|nr:hypothetical protein BDF21DRAFT_403868 [Thamnidium elegans]